ncbi:electron transfer flavoprotein subunit alpha/FixB family protein [bacterium]|nr:electron transfer flavoprotein subunit alpha/FixB family protein [bacterium]
MSNDMDNPWLAWAQSQEAALAEAASASGTLNTGNEYRNIWVYVETEGGYVAPETRKLMGKARELGDLLGARVQAVVLAGGEALAKDLIGYGADTVMLAEHPVLETFQLEAYAKALGQLVAAYKPEIFLFSASRAGEDLAPRLAARLGTGFLADATDLELDDAERLLRVTRQTFAEKILTVAVIAERKPQVVTVRPGVFREADFDRFRGGEVAKVEVDLAPEDRLTRIVGVLAPA